MNELTAIKEAGGNVIRIKRQMTTPYDDKAMDLLHNSETELANTSDAIFDYIIDNSGTLDELMVKIDNMVEELDDRN
jgi:dephospho-CoA kinase